MQCMASTAHARPSLRFKTQPRIIHPGNVATSPASRTKRTQFCVARYIIRKGSYFCPCIANKAYIANAMLCVAAPLLRPFRLYAIFLLQLFLSAQSSSCNPFSPIIPLIPSAQVSYGMLLFLLPDGRHSTTSSINPICN
jgi:hypothetical protein